MVEVFKGVDDKKTYYAVRGKKPDACKAIEEVARYKKTSVAKIHHYNIRPGRINYTEDGRKALWWSGDNKGDLCLVIYS